MRNRATYHRLELHFLLLLLAITASSSSVFAATSEHWTETWGSSQLKPSGADVLPKQALDHATVRQVVHVSLGGKRLRLRLSNAFGEEPLVLHSVQVARLGSGPGTIVPGTGVTVHFNGENAISIPAGSDYLSDSVPMPVAPLSDLVISILIESAPPSVTFHSGARATAFLLPGDHVADEDVHDSQKLLHWYFLSGLDVASTAPRGAVVTLGDSITDGHGSTNDANDRWTDVLARRLSALEVGVVNQGIGGNRILQDGLGPSALARFDRDVLSVPGARYLIVLEGINDLGTLSREAEQPRPTHDKLVENLKGAFRQMVARAHSRGILVYGGTITPYLGSEYYHPSARDEEDRAHLNEWIRTSKTFDAVIDFDAAVTDAANPGHLASALDSGDHLHPGPAGYARMGEAIPAKLFTKRP